MDNNILAKSQILSKIVEDIEQTAGDDLPILLLGETGTGKTYLARVIHSLLKKSDALFLILDCATFNPNLVESELFGHEKGAFTGAGEKKSGLFELACGGTILLEEIENLTLDLQAKLLRVIDEKKFRRVGGTEDLETYFQLISTLNVDVDELLTKGFLRKDFYYRISPLAITLPPLREKRHDILIFADYFLKILNEKYGRELILTKEAQDFLFSYQWLGNIRELKNTLLIVTRKAKKSNLKVEDFVEALRANYLNSTEHSKSRLSEIEKEHIERVLEGVGYRINRSARILGISENTLRAKIRKYKIKKQDKQ